MNNRWENYFNEFNSLVSNIALPKLFTFPFNYQPHELCRNAAEELQEELRDTMPKGRMYGVLVVKTKDQKLGYLAALSGSNYDDEIFKHFVPPIYKLSKQTKFYNEGGEELKTINNAILSIEESEEFKLYSSEVLETKNNAEQELNKLKEEYKKAKAGRDDKRKSSEKLLDNVDYKKLCAELIAQSQRQKGHLSTRKKYWKTKIYDLEHRLNDLNENLNSLKNNRKTKSAELQNKIFHQYYLLNANGNKRSLLDIFQESIKAVPPSAAGECAAPKLLQFAFMHDLKPIAMAEFWWGPSPKSEVRKQGSFYPACQSKCKPILGFMLQGLNVEPNPLLVEHAENKPVNIVFEDEFIVVINKPNGLLSIPGKSDSDSVYAQMKIYLRDATGPLIVHRLDMSTSGLMLIAKTKEAHENIQKQFLNRSIKKQYIALLNGIVKQKEGIIDLPLRVDLDNRPQQLVCFEYGKPAKTEWKVLNVKDGKTRIQFSPITGRTHQLRVHAAHQLGLNTPIVGDELYGKKADRLHLHAEQIEFVHPVSNQTMSFKKEAGF